MTTRAVLFAGGGDVTDPWHPFAATSRRIAALLEAEGVTTTIVDTVADLADAVGHARLLVLNAGSGGEPTPHDAVLLATIEAHLAAGRPLLALHAAAMLLPGSDAWGRALGGGWVPGASGHPPLGEARVALDTHKLVAGLGEVLVSDERYTALRVGPGSSVYAWHEEAGERHPLAWARHTGAARVVYDALGHDERSYDSASRCALLRAEVRWLLAGTD